MHTRNWWRIYVLLSFRYADFSKKKKWFKFPFAIHIVLFHATSCENAFIQCLVLVFLISSCDSPYRFSFVLSLSAFLFVSAMHGLEAQPPHMSGELKAGKEAHQNSAVLFTLTLLACSESFVCQRWPQISPADPDGQRRVIWDQTYCSDPGDVTRKP